MPFLLFFTALCIGATFFIADVPRPLGAVLFIIANFAYQAALIYYDATLKIVSYPTSRAASCPGIGTGIGYFGTVFVGLLIFLLDVPVEDRFRLTAILFAALRDPDLRVRAEPKRRRTEGRDRCAMSATAFGQLGGRSRTRARCRGWGASCSGGSSTRTPSTRSSS